MSYRPVTDVWFLARAKLRGGHKYYGAYLGGFPERARALLGVPPEAAVLHVCGGMARHYPYAGGFGQNDRTLDLDGATQPDFLADAREPLPLNAGEPWDAILADPPYRPEDAAHYAVGADAYPTPTRLLRNCLEAVKPGRRVGLIHYVLPSPPPGARFVAAAAVLCGFNNRVRVYSVFERAAADSASVARLEAAMERLTRHLEGLSRGQP